MSITALLSVKGALSNTGVGVAGMSRDGGLREHRKLPNTFSSCPSLGEVPFRLWFLR